MKHELHGQIRSLGKARAAIFALSAALAAGNVLAWIKGLMRGRRDVKDAPLALSGYYLALEISRGDRPDRSRRLWKLVRNQAFIEVSRATGGRLLFDLDVFRKIGAMPRHRAQQRRPRRGDETRRDRLKETSYAPPTDVAVTCGGRRGGRRDPKHGKRGTRQPIIAAIKKPPRTASRSASSPLGYSPRRPTHGLAAFIGSRTKNPVVNFG